MSSSVVYWYIQPNPRITFNQEDFNKRLASERTYIIHFHIMVGVIHI